MPPYNPPDVILHRNKKKETHNIMPVNIYNSFIIVHVIQNIHQNFAIKSKSITVAGTENYIV